MNISLLEGTRRVAAKISFHTYVTLRPSIRIVDEPRYDATHRLVSREFRGFGVDVIR